MRRRQWTAWRGSRCCVLLEERSAGHGVTASRPLSRGGRLIWCLVVCLCLERPRATSFRGVVAQLRAYAWQPEVEEAARARASNETLALDWRHWLDDAEADKKAPKQRPRESPHAESLSWASSSSSRQRHQSRNAALPHSSFGGGGDDDVGDDDEKKNNGDDAPPRHHQGLLATTTTTTTRRSARVLAAAAERAVLAELDKSLEAFDAPKDYNEALALHRQLFDARQNPIRLLVLDDRVFAHASFLRVDKNVKFATLLWSVVNERRRRRFRSQRADEEEDTSRRVVEKEEEDVSSADSETFGVGKKFPNFVALYDQSSTGRDLGRVKATHAMLPTLVISKVHGYAQPGILVPNPYFVSLNAWAYEIKRFEAAKRKYQPWTKRKKSVFWRGEIEFRRCQRSYGNFARLSMVSLSATHPDAFDVKCGDVCDVDYVSEFAKWTTKKNKSYASACDADAVFPGLSEDAKRVASSSVLARPHRRIRSTDAERGLETTKKKKKIQSSVASSLSAANKKFLSAAMIRDDESDHVDRPEYAAYRYVLNLPGRRAGSYSRNLNHLWFLGSVVFLFDAPYVEWYYPALRTGLTHVSVNASTAIDAFSLLNANKKTAHHLLIPSAQKVADRFLCPICLARYLARVARAMRRRFRMTDFLDDPTKFDAVFFSSSDDVVVTEQQQPPVGGDSTSYASSSSFSDGTTVDSSESSSESSSADDADDDVHRVVKRRRASQHRAPRPPVMRASLCSSDDDPLLEVIVDWDEKHPRLRTAKVNCRRPSDLFLPRTERSSSAASPPAVPSTPLRGDSGTTATTASSSDDDASASSSR